MIDLRYIFYVKVAIRIVCFIAAFYCLQALEFEKLIKQGRVFQAQLLYIMFSCSLGYLTSEFIISMIFQLNIW